MAQGLVEPIGGAQHKSKCQSDAVQKVHGSTAILNGRQFGADTDPLDCAAERANNSLVHRPARVAFRSLLARWNMWVVRARTSILSNVVTLVLLSILAGIVGGALVGMATRAKPGATSVAQPS